MKKITFLFLTVLSTVFYGQDKLTSSLSEFKVDGVFQTSSQSTYTYDENNNLTEEKDFFWNPEDESWILSFTTTYTYNNNNKVVSVVRSQYQDNEVIEQDRTLNTYNNLGNIISTVDQELQNNVWVNEERFEFSYTNSRLDFGEGFEWENNTWVNDGEGFQKLNYNSNGTIASFGTLRANNALEEEDDRVLYSYNSDNKLILETYQIWNGMSWDGDGSLSYTYDNNGNIVNEREEYNDDGEVVVFEDSYTFDTTQLLSDFAHPFKDKTGIDFLIRPAGFVNKIISTSNKTGSEDSDFRTTYFYGNEASLSTETNSVLTLKLYPNPTTDLVTVSGNNVSVKNIEVFNILGKKIKTVTTNTISLKEFVAGVYVLKIRTVDGKIAVKQILKQ